MAESPADCVLVIVVQKHPQHPDALFILFSWLVLILVVWVGRKAVVYYRHTEQEEQARAITESKDHFWMMSRPPRSFPEKSIRLWLPESGNHANEYPQDQYSPGLALATLLVLKQDIQKGNGHWHVVNENRYGGFRVDEFLDNRDGKGEFWAGTIMAVHYHGIAVDEDAGKEFLRTAAAQSHVIHEIEKIKARMKREE